MSTARTARRFHAWRGLALVVIAVVSVAACSSPSESPSGDGNATTVHISGRSFGADFTVPAGSSVVFVNDDGFGHTVTNGTDGVADENALFNVELSAGSSTDPIEFAAPGTYNVTCRIHATMHLTITVE